MELHNYPLLKKRLIQFMRITQITYAVIILVQLFQHIGAGEPLVFKPDLIKHVVILAFPELIIFFAKRERILFAVNLYLVVRLCILVVTMWSQGGLHSAIIVVFPWMLFFAAIYSKKNVHLFFCGAVLFSAMALGLNDMHQWVHTEAVQMLNDKARLAQLLVIYIVSGILSWTIARDLRFVYAEKKREQMRVIRANKKLQRLADTDQLTGLYNRYGAKRKFDGLKNLTDFSSRSILVLFIDIDDFKSINDLYGHHVGDKLLVKFGERLKRIADSVSVVSRLGGDEFVVATRQALGVDNDLNINAFHEALTKPYDVEGTGVILEITVSIGVVPALSKEQSFDELCSMADMAMYRVKAEGKNDFHYYDDELKQEYIGNLQILQGVQEAVDNNWLSLNYQTKLDTNSGEVVGVEALLRWEKNNPHNYNVSQIIPVIETTNLIHEVGYWVIKEACSICQSWHLDGKALSISVNVSAQQLTRQDFAKNVQQILLDTKLPASSLILELTEDALIIDSSEVVTQLREVKALGVKLAIDGFGSGYSNMTYLAELQVDELKMDKSFTSSVSSSEKTRLVIAAFINMANKLGIDLVAHGIETNKDHNTLKALGCKVGQGYFWGKPVPANELSL